MSRDLLAMLDYEAQQRPELAEIIAKIDLLDEAAIAAAPVKLPWMRRALLLLKRQHVNNLLAASLRQWVVDGHTADPLGEMRRWQGADTFVSIGRTQLEMYYGQLIWLSQNGVWIDTIWSGTIDPSLLSQSVACGTVRRSAYLMAVRDRARQLCPQTTPEPMERVRFFRPG